MFFYTKLTFLLLMLNFTIIEMPLEQFNYFGSRASANCLVGLLFAFLICSFWSGWLLINGSKLWFFELLSFSFLKHLGVVFFGLKYYKFSTLFNILFLLLVFFNLCGVFVYSFSIVSIAYFTTCLVACLFFWLIFNLIFRFNINFFSVLVPTGIPGFLVKSLVFVEIATLVGRLLTLNLRLFVNILSGQLLLKLAYLFWFMFLQSCICFSSILGILFFLFLCFFLFCLEVFIAILQSYIFFFLVVIYTNNMFGFYG